MLKKCGQGHNLNLKLVVGRHGFSKLSEHLLFKTNKCHFISQVTCILERSRKGPLVISVYGICQHKVSGFYVLSCMDSDHLSFQQHLEHWDSTGWFSHPSPHTADIWKCLETVWVVTTRGRREGAIVMDRTQGCRSTSSNVRNYPPTTRITQPQISGVERALEKRENKSVCFLQIGTILYLSGCCQREPELSFRQAGIPDGVISSGFLSLHSTAQIRFYESCLRSIPSSLTLSSDLRTLPSHNSNESNKNMSPPWNTQRFLKAGAMDLWNETLRNKALIERMFCSHPPFHTFHVLMSASLALWTHHDCITFCYRKLDFWVLTIQEND